MSSNCWSPPQSHKVSTYRLCRSRFSWLKGPSLALFDIYPNKKQNASVRASKSQNHSVQNSLTKFLKISQCFTVILFWCFDKYMKVCTSITCLHVAFSFCSWRKSTASEGGRTPPQLRSDRVHQRSRTRELILLAARSLRPLRRTKACEFMENVGNHSVLYWLIYQSSFSVRDNLLGEFRKKYILIWKDRHFGDLWIKIR